MTLTEQVAKKIILKLINSNDYRIEIVTLINAEFLQFSIAFFKKIINAKLNNKNVSTDWYKNEFLDSKLLKEDIAINSGLNMKTINNMFNRSTKQIVINASIDHYETLYKAISDLVESENELELTLTIKFNGVSVDLNVSETLIVINTLAVKRAALRGGFWATAGKRVEKPLMQVLCELYKVPKQNYQIKIAGAKNKNHSSFEREIDFYLCAGNKNYKCEVKLMGKGNPESADAVIARDSSVFIADKLSETNKRQLNSRGVLWVELRAESGYKNFKNVLEKLRIPYKNYSGLNIDKDVGDILKNIL